MKEKVLDVIRKYNLIEDKDNILIGLSGGPDSMALLFVLLEIKEYIDFNIFVAHVNHGVRGKEALEDEKFVEELANRLNLPYFSKTVNMDEYAKINKMSSEEAGRELRYEFFREVLSKIGGGKIAVAHNKNDQAETLLMRILRGTGLDGLKGMEYKKGDIIRPLLGIERKEIENFLKERNIEYRIDRTNLEPIYGRNKIRLNLIPYIEENYNPNIIDTLWRTSEIIGIDNDFIEMHCEKIYNSVVKERSKNSIILDGNAFVSQHRSIQYRIIRNCLLEINGSLQGFTYKHISDVVFLFLERGTGKSIHLTNNIVAKTSYDNFIIERKEEEENKEFFYTLKLNSFTYVKEIGYGFNTKVEPIEHLEIKNIKNSDFIKYFDYDKVIGNIYVRNRRSGDRFKPFGMKGSKKIKDYFIDEKIPKDKRDKIPLVVDDKNIIWVVGYRISDQYRITKNTKNVLIIEVKNQHVKEV